MATWKETLEPYVKVIESVKTAALNPTAGEDLIIGAVIISDTGPSTPTLITSQSEFLSTFAGEDISEEYVETINDLYTEDGAGDLASTMWLNAYRLSGSANMLICRALDTDGMAYSKPLMKGSSLDDYIVKDGQLMKKISTAWKLCIDHSSPSVSDGWAISISDIGVIGNFAGDYGPIYDYYVSNIKELVDKLFETGKFYSPSYTYYTSEDNKTGVDQEENIWGGIEGTENTITCVQFDEVYLASSLLDKEVEISDANNQEPFTQKGMINLVTALPNWYDGAGEEDPQQKVIDLNDASYSGFTPTSYYATNINNSRSELKVRIRRFNHNAVSQIITTDPSASPYEVLTSVVKVYEENLRSNPNDETILEYDFYEFAVLDPSVSEDWLLFNVGNIGGRGDITIDELNSSLGMINLTLPTNLKNLNLEYYCTDDGTNAKEDQIEVSLGIDEDNLALIKVSSGSLKKAWDKIEDDERYVVEGMTDLGNTNSEIQNYMANMAINSNYFYAISTVNSTNYMTITNKASKITGDSRKLYMLSPWDYDDGTVGFLFNVSPSVIYWETVCRNRLNNNEFAGAFGQNTGVVSIVKLAKEFKKTERQLLLTKKVNTIFHDLYLERYYINDNYTKQTEENVMSEECNSRFQIRISKAMPLLLNQFKGRQANARTWADATSVIDYWFKTVIIPMNYSISDYQITCDSSNNTDEDVRANRMNVRVEVRFYNSIKYIIVYNDAYPIGVEFTGGAA